jgi:hypothetical protein
MAKNNHQEQIDTAIALAKTAANTATALAAAKAASDIISASMAKDIEYIKISLSKIDITLQEANTNYVNKTEHKEVTDECADHESRLRVIEKYMWLAIGALYIVNAVLGFYLLSKH